MKRFFLLLLAVLTVLSLPASVVAADSNAFYVNNAYFKGDGKYDIVVHGSNRETLRLYVNDKNPVKAKVNKQGWATFRNVELTGQSKISFAKRVKLRYVPVNYVKYISVDGEQVKLSDTGPKHSFDEFIKWYGSNVQYKYNDYVPSVEVPRFDQIRKQCEGTKNGFDNRWVTCMQEAHKDYLKSEAFVAQDGNYGPILEFLGTVDAIRDYGVDNTSSHLTQKDVETLRAKYNQIALTK